MILKKELVAGSQLWYLVRYRRDVKRTVPVIEGWVWGGSPGVDDTRYIQGATSQKFNDGDVAPGWRWVPSVTAAYAQADTSAEGALPVTGGTQGSAFGSRIPLWIITPPGSMTMLFIIMVVGMVAEAIWDQTDRGAVVPSSVQLVRPILISPS
jgi:hypothetical protein